MSPTCSAVETTNDSNILASSLGSVFLVISLAIISLGRAFVGRSYCHLLVLKPNGAFLVHFQEIVREEVHGRERWRNKNYRGTPNKVGVLGKEREHHTKSCFVQKLGFPELVGGFTILTLLFACPIGKNLWQDQDFQQETKPGTCISLETK